MKVNTLFPSKKQDEGTKGGIIILKLSKESPNARLNLRITYEDRLGVADSKEMILNFENTNPDFYQNQGIRKGILLSRYADLMKNMINDERIKLARQQELKPVVNEMNGIAIPSDSVDLQLGQWERQSVVLTVSPEYKKLIEEFRNYFSNEMAIIGDTSLSREIEIMDQLSK